MANFCLHKDTVTKFLRSLKDGTLNPEEMVKMSSKDRRALLETVVGKEHAEAVNREFEQKMLTKNIEQTLVTWAKQVAGLKPKTRQDMIARIERMDERILDPANEEAFLKDLAAQKLGAEVSVEEAQKVNELSQNIKNTKAAEAKGEATARDVAWAEVNLENYVNDLKIASTAQDWHDFKQNPLKTSLKVAAKAAVNFPGLTKTLKASLDNSAAFLTAQKTAFTNPTLWAKDTAKSFSDIVRTFGNKPVTDEIKVDIRSRENWRNGKFQKMKLDTGTREEDFPISSPFAKLNRGIDSLPISGPLGFIGKEVAKLPGKAFVASENAYVGLLHRLRADIADKLLPQFEKQMPDATPKDYENLGRMINALTGRGHLGRLEAAADAVNVAMFSPRFLKAQIDTLTQMGTGGASIGELAQAARGHGGDTGTNFVRKQAAMNLLKFVGGTAGVLALANFLKPGSVDWDPRSSDFGKIVVGNTRFDVSGHLGGLVTLIARLGLGSSKSSTTGIVTPLNETDSSGKPKFASRTKLDVTEDFLENKASPIGQILLDWSRGHDFQGNPVDFTSPATLKREASNLLEPLPITNVREMMKDPAAAPTVLGVLLDAVGITANTYGGSKHVERLIKEAGQRGDAKEANRLQGLLPLIQQQEALQKTQRKAEYQGDNPTPPKGVVIPKRK